MQALCRRRERLCHPRDILRNVLTYVLKLTSEAMSTAHPSRHTVHVGMTRELNLLMAGGLVLTASSRRKRDACDHRSTFSPQRNEGQGRLRLHVVRHAYGSQRAQAPRMARGFELRRRMKAHSVLARVPRKSSPPLPLSPLLSSAPLACTGRAQALAYRRLGTLASRGPPDARRLLSPGSVRPADAPPLLGAALRRPHGGHRQRQLQRAVRRPRGRLRWPTLLSSAPVGNSHNRAACFVVDGPRAIGLASLTVEDGR